MWARDTLPALLIAVDPAEADPMAAGRVRFNGWGDKQAHAGDTRLAAVVAEVLDIPLIDSVLTGEGGGFEVDGAGTVMASRSCWINDNRNPGWTEQRIQASLLDLLGAERMIWVDGIAGEDITDGHIDSLARFVSPKLIAFDVLSYEEPGEPWYDAAVRTETQLRQAVQADGAPYELVGIAQPERPRGTGAEFLSSYLNYYVCNGAVIAPQFGDPHADDTAGAALRELYPGRDVVQLDIDPVAAGGGGIHCATQQEPRPTR